MTIYAIFSDATQHERHHEFLEDPEKVYKDNHLKYCFGTKYITAEVRL